MDEIIKEWLEQYEPIEEIAEFEEIHTEDLTDNLKNLAMQRNGVDNIAPKYVSEKGKRKRFQYVLLLKSESEDDLAKLYNYKWLDDLTNWLDKKNTKQDFPNIEDNIKITKIECANAITFDKNEDGSIAIYSLQIFVETYQEYVEEIESL